MRAGMTTPMTPVRTTTYRSMYAETWRKGARQKGKYEEDDWKRQPTGNDVVKGGSDVVARVTSRGDEAKPTPPPGQYHSGGSPPSPGQPQQQPPPPSRVPSKRPPPSSYRPAPQQQQQRPQTPAPAVAAAAVAAAPFDILRRALDANDRQTMRRLLGSGLHPDADFYDAALGVTLLMRAAIDPTKFEIVQMLLAHGADPNRVADRTG